MEENTFTLKAGAGRAALKYPEKFFPQENFSKIHDDICARAILLEQKERILIISLELPSVRPYSLVDEMRERLHDMTGIGTEHIWVCMTHNLAGPHVPKKEQFPEKYEMHMKAVYDAVYAACWQARENFQEVRLGIGFGAADINGNRDVKTNQGWWLGAGGEGISDKLLTVFRLEGISGAPIALIYHYAVKSSAAEGICMKDGTSQMTSDVTGRASREIEQEFGVPALFFMGAAADQVPKKKGMYFAPDKNGDMVEINLGEQAYEFIEEQGVELGNAVIETAKKIRCTREQSYMRVWHETFFFPGQKKNEEGHPYRPLLEYEYIPAKEEELPAEILQLGDAVLFGLQPETTAVIGIRLRERVKGLHPLFIAMVNGGKDYISDVSAYDRLTFAGTHSVFARGSAEMLLDKLEAWIHEMQEEKVCTPKGLPLR